MLRRLRAPIGLDIGSSAIKVVAVRRLPWPRLVTAIVEPMLPDRLVDGVVADPSALAADLRTLWQRHRLRRRRVAISIGGSGVCLKRFALPPMPVRDVPGAVRWEASRHLPAPSNEMAYDYCILRRSRMPRGRTTDAPSAPGVDVLLAAVRRDALDGWTAVSRAAGLDLVAVDVAPLALQRAWEATRRSIPRNETVALVDLGASTTSINVVSAGTPVLARDVPSGARRWTEAVQRVLGVSFDEAERMKCAWRSEARDDMGDRLAAALRAATDHWLFEVGRTFDYAISDRGAPTLQRIAIAGGGSKLSGLLDAVSSHFGVPVEVVGWSSAAAHERRRQIEPDVALALGLAVRRRSRSCSR
jgi:type IV pilus assembly protein PilM